MIYSDIHTHTTYCDGKSTPEEMVKKAIEKGFESIGISGHGYMDFDVSYCMTLEDTKKYVNEINELKKKYPQTDILLGLERDYYFAPDGQEYDYVIGSVHYVEKNGVRYDVDYYDVFADNVEKHSDGNFRTFVELYYETVKDVVNKTGADVVGHFDLVAKFNDGNKFFDEDADWYKECVIEALDEVSKTKPIFEVNTGAMSRGYNKIYPSEFILKEIKKRGCDVVITSDCHDAETLGDNYDKAIELVKKCGFDKVFVLTKNGFKYRDI